MTVGELIEALEDMPEDLRIRVAIQPNWPLAETIVNVRTLNSSEGEDGGEATVWLATASVTGLDESPYAPRIAWSDEEQ